LKLHLPSVSTSYLPWYLAIERGYIAEQNLDVEIVQATGTVGTKALVAGEMDFSGAASSALPAVAKGAPLKVVFAQSARANYWLIARPEIKTLADLKGKRIVVPSLGAGDAYSRLARGALQKAGIDPARDVEFVAGGAGGGGSTDVLVGAMVGGVAQAMVGNILQRLSAEAQGFQTVHAFSDNADLQGGVVTTENLLKNKPQVARGFLTAAVKGMRVIAADPETSLGVLLKYVKLDRNAAAQGLGVIRPLATRDGYMGPEEQNQVLEALKVSLELPADMSVEKAFDFGPIQEAAKAVDASGWKPK
jgi:NitT/TauT family transport system substrate-binding protein